MIEMALIMLLFLTLVLGMLDLGIGVFRYNTLAQAARQGSRQAIVHGSLAVEPWGPDTYSALANDTSPIAEVIRPSLSGFDLSEVTINAEWGGGNTIFQGNTVCVTVTAPYRPIMAMFLWDPITLQATSTMAIAH
jgi:Flp pilus assembly protein TadG